MLIPETVVLVLLPALSVAVPVADWAAPAALRVIGLVQLAIPERTSEQRKLAVTSLLFQPLALAAGLRLPLIAGPVLSMLIPETVALALLPALSVAVPVTLWLAPSALSVTSGGQLAIPESASAQVKCTVTEPPSYQPAALGEVVAAPLIVGAVLSIVKTWPVKFPLPVPVPPSLFPAASTIVSLSTRLSPSVPSPVPVPVVTVYEAPVPVTLVKDAPVMPVGASAKSAVSTPVTLSLKVTVHCTL